MNVPVSEKYNFPQSVQLILICSLFLNFVTSIDSHFNPKSDSHISKLKTDIDFCNDKRYEYCINVKTDIFYEISDKIPQEYKENVIDILQKSVSYSGTTVCSFYNSKFWMEQFDEKIISAVNDTDSIIELLKDPISKLLEYELTQ